MNSRFTRKALTTAAALAIAAGAATGIAATAQAAPAVDVAATVSTDTIGWIDSPEVYANVRKGPGMNYGVMDTLRTGTKVNVVEVRGAWSHLSSGGWVANWLIVSKNPVKPTPTKPQPTKPRPTTPKPTQTATTPPVTRPTPTPKPTVTVTVTSSPTVSATTLPATTVGTWTPDRNDARWPEYCKQQVAAGNLPSSTQCDKQVR